MSTNFREVVVGIRWLSGLLTGLVLALPVGAMALTASQQPPELPDTAAPRAAEATQQRLTRTAQQTEAEQTEEPSEEGSEDGIHGEIVSTVAKCAPRGREVDLLEGVANHGAAVQAAAHGEPFEFGGTSYDLTTAAGAEALCAAFEAALATAESSQEDGDAPGRSGEHGKPDKPEKSEKPQDGDDDEGTPAPAAARRGALA